MKKFINYKTVFIFLIIIYIATRVYILFLFEPKSSDVYYYAKLAYESIIASKTDTSVYQIFAENNKIPFDYPPLAFQWITLPNFLINQSIFEFIDDPFNIFLSNYIFWYRILSALVEIITFLFFLNYLFSRKFNFSEITEKSLIFILGGFALLHILYDRLDIILGCLILCSLILLLKRKYLWSFFLLALSINFKIVPIILIPIWLIGSLPYQIISNKKNIRIVVLYLIRQLGIILFFIIIIFLPFLIIYGQSTLNLFLSHISRGIQLESIYSSIIIVLNAFFNLNAHIILANNAYYNLNSNISDILIVLSSIVLFGLLFFSTLLFISNFLFYKKNSMKQKIKLNITIAYKIPDIFICYTIFFIIISISASKVFSPQYLLWLVPIFPLISYKKILFRISSWIFVLTCIITTVIFPYLYFTDIITGPTLLGASLLIIRNILVIFIVVIFIIELIKEVKTKELSILD